MSKCLEFEIGFCKYLHSFDLWYKRCDAKPERLFEMKDPLFGVVVVVFAVVLKTVGTITVHCPNDETGKMNLEVFQIVNDSKYFLRRKCSCGLPVENVCDDNQDPNCFIKNFQKSIIVKILVKLEVLVCRL